MIELTLADIQAGFKMRPDSFDTTVTLRDLKVADKKTVGTLHPFLVDSKPRGGATDLVTFDLKHNPLDGRADERIKLKIEPVEVVFNHALVAEVGKFFIPKRSTKNFDTLATTAASSGLDQVTSATRIGLEHAMSKRKILDLHVEVDAPVIVAPQSSMRKDAFVIVADLGRILLTSKPVSKESQEEVFRLTGQPPTPEGKARLESLIYDRFDISVTALQVVAGTSLADLHTIMSSGQRSPAHLLHPVGLTLTAEKCILANTYEHADLRLTGTLTEVNVVASDRTLVQLAGLGKTVGESFATMKVSPSEITTPLSGEVSKADPMFEGFHFSGEQGNPEELANKILSEAGEGKKVTPAAKSADDNALALKMAKAVKMQASFTLTQVSVTLMNEG